MGNRVSESMLRRIRDYAVDEPGFTCAFAAWDLGANQGFKVDPMTVKGAVERLVELGIVKLVEDNGTYGKVYAYVPPPTNGKPPQRIFAELDESRLTGLEAPKRGVVVPHTRAVGPSGKPGQDRKRQALGARVKRQRQGT